MQQSRLIILQILFINLEEWVTCSIGGLTYMDDIKQKDRPSTWPRGEDPCNPLYWYPRQIPEYCYYKNNPAPIQPPGLPPIPLPIPVPVPQTIPMPMLPAAGGLYPSYPSLPNQNDMYHQKQTGMVPGLPGLVSSDGGLNILPFSDAYSDMIENHKQKILKKRFRQLVEDYEDYPWRRRDSRSRRKRRRRHRKRIRNYY